MKKHRNSTGTSADPISVMAERMRMTHDLLPRLVLAMAANEETQRKFRNAVLIRLARIDTMVLMIHGAQIAEAEMRQPHGDEARMRRNAEDTEAFIDKNTEELVVAMVRYIYGKSKAPSVPHDRRRKWSGWEI